jgi:hypothetical protein
MPFNDHSSMYIGGSRDVMLGVDSFTTIAGDGMHHQDEDDDNHHHHHRDTLMSAHPFPPASFAGDSYAAYQQQGM